jgi:hypothetical protein
MTGPMASLSAGDAAPQESLRETRYRARETKFVTSLALYEPLLEWARRRFGPDGHGTGPDADAYATRTLYFETRAFDVYHRRGSYGRSKYRIRRYDTSPCVFLERKFRTARLLAKRRTIVPVDAICALDHRECDRTWPGRWFHERLQLRRLRPLVQLSYDRVARVSPGPSGPVRMTIDRNLRALPLADFAFLPPIGLSFLEDACIVEVKYQVALPAVFREMAAAFGLEVQNVSKFRAALRALDYPLQPQRDEQVPQQVGVDLDPAGTYAD